MVLRCSQMQPPGADDGGETPELHRQTFPASFRTQIAELTEGGRNIEDLAASFPALLFALATDYATPERRRVALDAILAGKKLKAVAQLLGLPFWLRRLPPAALTGPLPVLPDDPDFALTAVPALPRQPEAMLPWLDFISLADRLAGRDVALWFARHHRLTPPVAANAEALWTLAWAFYAKHPDTLAGRIQRRSWTPRTGPRSARDETANWRKRIEGLLALGTGFPDTWFANGTAMGYEFIALKGPEDLFAECASMRNCLDLYALRLGHMRSRLFSVRARGKSIATLELGLRNDEVGVPFIVQLRGIGNRRASPSVWQAVHAWMGSQSFAHLDHVPRPKRMSLVLRREIWAPLTETAAAIGMSARVEPLTIGRSLKQRT
ncbi:MAG: hypothetical protein J0J14_03880 [Hyphomicrobium sp.]|nr:hypothetical protein [Hyphomicrobium sp.]